MDTKILNELAASVATRRCVLFAGAGLTSNGGGATWSDLVEFLKVKFNYKSPLNDKFQIMGDMFRKYNPEEIYEAVQNKLKNACIKEPISKLTALPWFTTFTTNYDIALEKCLVENQSLSILTILTGDEFILEGLPSEMLCVKLMGSLDKHYRQPGSMVLTPGDLVIAKDARSKIFDKLASHAANLSFLFVGYSFEDGLFIEILEKIMQTIEKPAKTYYAVFKNEPDEEKRYLLKQYNVEIIIEDLGTFSEELTKLVAIRNPTDFTLKRIPIGIDIVPIEATNVTNFLSLYNPVLFEDLEEPVSAYFFLKGNTKSFKPFALNWHFQRSEIRQIIDSVLKVKNIEEQSIVVAVEGSPGSGRTFAILATIYDMITKYRALAIRIPNSAINPIPTKESIAEFLEEINRASKEIGVKNFEYIVFWAEFTPTSNIISQFKKLSSFVEYPTIFIFETYPGHPELIVQRAKGRSYPLYCKNHS